MNVFGGFINVFDFELRVSVLPTSSSKLRWNTDSYRDSRKD